MQTSLSGFETIAELADAIRARKLSPVELTEALLGRIEALNGTIHAYVTVTADEARAQARQAEAEIAAGTYRGPLHGIPYAVKDVYQTKGIRTTASSFALEHWVPDTDAATIVRMREAGAVLAGKLATFEFSTGSDSEGPFPAARNPWNVEHTPRGSSSGSGASVAAGMAFASLGGDTGGSIRGPAGACGIVGLRPTYGRVSRRGVIPLSWSIDTAGPLARTVRDCAFVLQAIAGYDAADPGSARHEVPSFTEGIDGSIAGLHIGIDRKTFFNPAAVNAHILEAMEAALGELTRLGARLVPIELPLLRHAPAAQALIHMTETHAYHAPRILRGPQGYGPSVRGYFRLGAFIEARDYLQAQRVREAIRREMLDAFANVDLIVSPTLLQPAERFTGAASASRVTNRLSQTPNTTTPFSLAGVPALSVPCGFSPEGLPLGMQIAGRPFDEATVFRAAHAYEQATPWHTMHPEISPA